MNSGASGPNGTVVKKLNAESVPEKKPGLDQAESTEPFETAGMVCNPGTNAPGSYTLSSRVPPEARLTFSTNFGAASPISVRLVGNMLAMFICTVWPGCAFACAGGAWLEPLRSPQETVRNEAAAQHAASSGVDSRFMVSSSLVVAPHRAADKR